MKKRTPSRTDLDRFTDEEIVAKFGQEHLIISKIKAQQTHDASRHERRREDDARHQRRKKRVSR